MGGMGIPGDLSSQSRFVKVAFTKLNSISGEEEDESVSQFFHIFGSVDQQRGCCEVTCLLYTSNQEQISTERTQNHEDYFFRYLLYERMAGYLPVRGI